MRVPGIRRWLLAVLLLGVAGMLTDLLLLAHYEDVAQLIPVALLVAAQGLLAWHVARPSPRNVRALQAVMALFVVAGLAGVGFHFNGAAGFQRDIDPSLPWWTLLGKVARSQSPPLLAPGAMLQLGLIGLIYAARHPRTRPPVTDLKEVER